MHNAIRLRLAAVLVALVAGFAPAVIVAQPAHAAWSEPRESNDCWHCSDEDVNLEVWYKRDMDNTGFYLSTVTIQGCYFPCTSTDGKVLKCMNQNGTVVWSKPGDVINLGQADTKSWAPHLEMPHAGELKCVYSGRAHLFLHPDADFTDTVWRT